MREFERAFRRSPSGIAKRRRELILKRNPVQLLGFGVRHALPNRLDLGFFFLIAFVSPSLSPAMAGRLSVGLGSKRRPKLCYGFIYFLTTFLRVIFILFHFFPLFWFVFIYSFSLFIIPCSSFFQQRFKEQHFSSMDEVKAAVRNCFRKQDGKSYR